jgi:hypothetical protein
MVADFLDAALDDMATVPQAANRQPEFAAKLIQIGAAQVSKLDPLEVSPDPFVGIEVGRVAGKLLQVDALGTAIGQELLDDLGSMDESAVPDHREKTGDMTQQVLQETNDILATVGPVLDTQVQVPVGSDAADGREMIPSERHLQDRRLSSGSVGAHHRGEQVEAALVYPEEGSAFLLGLFLTSGHRSVIHLWMASSLRWVARWIGFWLLHPAALRSRRA